MKNIFIFILLLMISSSIAQKTKDFSSTNYAEIIKRYSTKIENGEKLTPIESKELAYSYFANNEFKKALPLLKNLEKPIVTQELYFKLNHCYKSNNEFEKGNEHLTKYYSLQKNIDYGQFLKDLYSLKVIGNRYTVKNIKKINTEHSEFLNSEDSTDIYFSSNKKKNSLTEGKYSWNNENYYNQYRLNKKDSTIVSISELNSNFHDANLIYTTDGKYGFYTSNIARKDVFLKENQVLQLNIYQINLNEHGKEISKEIMPFNSSDFSCKNPFYDNETGLLYFSSNMPKGKGGYDIYSYDINDSNSLKNISEINTINDEDYIFIDKKKNIYFSSNGYYGFGGKDIFARQFDTIQKTYKRIMNIGLPINSAADDFGFVINKKNGFYNSNISGNDDIYEFKEIKDLDLDKVNHYLKGSVIDELSKEKITDLEITLLDKKTGDKINLNLETNGTFQNELINTDFGLELNSDDYELVTKDLVLNTENFSITNKDILVHRKKCQTIYKGKITFDNLNGKVKEVDIHILDLKDKLVTACTTDAQGNFTFKYGVDCNQNLIFRTYTAMKSFVAPYYPDYIEYLKPTDKRIVVKNINFKEVSAPGLLVNELGQLLVDTKPIFFDSGKFNLKPDTKKELQKVLAILKYDDKYILSINSHTDNKGNDDKNLILSENRAKSTYDYFITNGIPKERVKYNFFGETKPLIDCGEICNPAELAKNRRSEFEINLIN